MHIFPTSGSYNVRLTVIVCTDTSTYTATANVWAVGNNSTQPPQPACMLYPNPASNELWVSSSHPQAATLRLCNALGQVVHSQPIPPNATLHINTQLWASGIYYYTISQAATILQRQQLLINP